MPGPTLTNGADSAPRNSNYPGIIQDRLEHTKNADVRKIHECYLPQKTSFSSSMSEHQPFCFPDCDGFPSGTDNNLPALVKKRLPKNLVMMGTNDEMSFTHWTKKVFQLQPIRQAKTTFSYNESSNVPCLQPKLCHTLSLGHVW